MKLSPREILFALSYQNKGEWKTILQDLKEKKPLSKEDIDYCHRACRNTYLSLLDEEYPSYFKEITHPPFLLYYYGNISLLHHPHKLSVVGTRKPTLYQNDTVYQLIQKVEEKTNCQTCIVSGMAQGIDQASLKAARDRNAPIIAVIGSGIDNPYPRENDGLYEYCKGSNGLILSEYPGNCNAKRDNFIFRNRLIVALSEILFVGGGKLHSGTSSSANLALDYNKEILALPCNISGDDLTNVLIRDGATSVLDENDILSALKAQAEK